MEQQTVEMPKSFIVNSVLGTVHILTEAGLRQNLPGAANESLDDLPTGVLSVTNRHTGQYENLYLTHLTNPNVIGANVQYALKESFLPALLRHEVFEQHFVDNSSQFSMNRTGAVLEHQVHNLGPFFTLHDRRVSDMLAGEFGVTSNGTTYANINTTDTKNRYGSVDLFRAWMTSERPEQQAPYRIEDGVKFTAAVKYSSPDGKTVTATLMYGYVSMQIGANIRKFFETPNAAGQFVANLFMSKLPFLDVTINFED